MSGSNQNLDKDVTDARDTPGRGSFIRRMIELPNDSTKKILFVATALCLVCSILVSIAAVALRPIQATNAEIDRRRNILSVAGLLEPGTDASGIEQQFERFERHVVRLDTGDYDETLSAAGFDARTAAANPDSSRALSPEEDMANIRRQANHAEVYLLRGDDGSLQQVILPVYGSGLWSTLYGYLSLEGDLRTIQGLQFYEHAETPGLGGEVDNPDWRRLWRGKLAYAEDGSVAVNVIKGHVEAGSAKASYQIDGLSGATLTSRGVDQLVRFWLGDQGFGPFLNKLAQGAS